MPNDDPTPSDIRSDFQRAVDAGDLDTTNAMIRAEVERVNREEPGPLRRLAIPDPPPEPRWFAHYSGGVGWAPEAALVLLTGDHYRVSEFAMQLALTAAGPSYGELDAGFLSQSFRVQVRPPVLWATGDPDEARYLAPRVAGGNASSTLYVFPWTEGRTVPEFHAACRLLGAGLAVIDPVENAFSGNRDSYDDSARWLYHELRTRSRSRCTTIMVQHAAATSDQEKIAEHGYLGESPWFNAPRAVWCLRRRDGMNDNRAELQLLKSNYGPLPARPMFLVRHWADVDGVRWGEDEDLS